MSRPRIVPMLPCRDIDESVSFYEVLGFRRTYRQIRPNPYAVVSGYDLDVHLFGIDGFDPEESYGSVGIAVADPDALYETFAAGMRAVHGKLLIKGIPRILRPRKKQGTVAGFSVVDPGGNWLRIWKLGDTEAAANAEDTTTGLARVLINAARLGDAHGDAAFALRLLNNGLARFADASPLDRVKVMLYRAELAVRVDDLPLATLSLSEAEKVDLTDSEKATVSEEFLRTKEIVTDA